METIRTIGVVLLCLAVLLAPVNCLVALSDTTPPSQPANLACTSPCSDNMPTFIWDAATDNDSGVDYYKVTIISSDGRGPLPYSIGKVTTYTHGNPMGDGDFTFSIVAVDKAGNVGPAARLGFTIDTVAPNISGVTASSITETGCTINWTTSEDAACQVEYGTTTAYGSSQLASVDFLRSYAYSYIINLTGLTANTTYHYRVRSIDWCGNEAVSADYLLVTLPS